MTEYRQRTTTWLTFVVAVVWVGSIGFRVKNPDWALGPSIDALMLTAAGFWFSTDRRDKR